MVLRVAGSSPVSHPGSLIKRLSLFETVNKGYQFPVSSLHFVTVCVFRLIIVNSTVQPDSSLLPLPPRKMHNEENFCFGFVQYDDDNILWPDAWRFPKKWSAGPDAYREILWKDSRRCQ